MKKTTNVSFWGVRKSSTLINKSDLLNLVITEKLCLLKERHTNKKTEVKLIWRLFTTVLFCCFKVKNINKM